MSILAGMPIMTQLDELARQMKRELYADQPWTPKLAFEIGHKMAALKKITKPFFSDVDEIEQVRALSKYKKSDFEEAFEIGNPKTQGGVSCDQNQPKHTGQLMRNSMVINPPNR